MFLVRSKGFDFSYFIFLTVFYILFIFIFRICILCYCNTLASFWDICCLPGCLHFERMIRRKAKQMNISCYLLIPFHDFTREWFLMWYCLLGQVLVVFQLDVNEIHLPELWLLHVVLFCFWMENGLVVYN